MMQLERIQEIIEKFAALRIVVCGDFFLDRYLELDPALNETSIETGKTAYQVVGKRSQPGAAGTVCNNLTALGVQNIYAVTLLGDDGEGYELRQELQRRQIAIEDAILCPDRFTPTYMKPMLRQQTGEEELERMDTKNRQPLAAEYETQICERLIKLAKVADAVILADQVQERNCGVLSDQVRNAINDIAQQFPSTLFFADSRRRIGEFRNITVKPNRNESINAADLHAEDTSTAHAIKCAMKLHQQNQKPVFLTLDAEGICPVPDCNHPIPCPPVQPNEKIDIVGAGDSTTAAIVSALAAGATATEAAILGNLAASITIRQLGTTGTASPKQILQAFHSHQDLYSS